ELLDDTVLPSGLSGSEEREACRALKGSIMRQEIYADDAGPAATPAEVERARTPYVVTEQNFSIRVGQPCGRNRHAVFFTHPREAITVQYERNSADPRVQHAVTLEVDDYGNVLEEAKIGYGRRQRDVSLPADADRDKQSLIHITYTKNSVSNFITQQPDQYR